jgi:hypothetical protein
MNVLIFGAIGCWLLSKAWKAITTEVFHYVTGRSPAHSETRGVIRKSERPIAFYSAVTAVLLSGTFLLIIAAANSLTDAALTSVLNLF